jgi:hypothetical protein
MSKAVRPERSFERFSRTLELVRAIKAMWEAHDRIPASVWPRSTVINWNIDRLMEEFDLTIPEWHYWAEQVRQCR